MAENSLAGGADGCRGGGVYVVIDSERMRVERCAVAPTFSELLLQTTVCAVLGIDIPIGLALVLPTGGRAVDREARDLLKPHRHQSVFLAPPREVLQARSYEEASELQQSHSEGRQGMSRQAFGILPKIAEVDDLMTPRLQQRVVEVHPELSFMELNGGVPLELGKTTAAGLLKRIDLLAAVGLTEGLGQAATAAGAAAKLDDLLDATAAAWTAARFARDEAIRIPDMPEVDQRGLRMEMWR